MVKHIIEAYSRIDEQAHITGVALIPRISRNNNLYTKEELKRFDNVTVPLNWEHDTAKQIGNVTFHYNEEFETVYYNGFITDNASAELAKNKTLYTSIEADPTDMKEICNGPNDCFNMPYGLTPVGLALTSTPGVPETTVKVIESYIKECEADKELEKKYGLKKEDNLEKLDDKLTELPDLSNVIRHSECENNERVTELENQNKLLLREIEKLKEAIYCKDCGKVKKVTH